MRRALIVPASYPPILGGVQIVSHRLACHLKKRGWAVEVLTRRYPRSLEEKEDFDGVPVVRRRFFPSIGDSFRAARPDLIIRSIWTRSGDLCATRQILERSRPDVVNIHFPNWQVDLIPLIRSIGGSRLVVSLHGNDVMRAVNGDAGQRRRLIAALQAADQVTACSQWLLDHACSIDPAVAGKSTVAWNGIDVDRFTSIQPHRRSRPYILGFGRFVPAKGFDLLVEAFAALPVDCGVDLVLVGSGPELGHLKRLAADGGIAERVFFPGRAFEEDMIRWIGGAHLAVVPSREESFGISALEVAAAGVPLVATSVGGMPEVLGEMADSSGSVLLCEPHVQNLTDAMAQLLADRGKHRDDVDMIDRLRADFCWEERMKVYEEVFLGASDSHRANQKSQTSD